MKKIIISLVVFLVVLFSFQITYAEQCFPHGKISISAPNLQTLEGTVSSMGDISFFYPGHGTLNGVIDSLGYFTASNDEFTVKGTVDTSCSGTSISRPPIATMCPPPSMPGCIQESDYQSLEISGGRYGLSNESFWIQKLALCRQQIDDYKQATIKWNQCEKDYYGYDPATGIFGKTKAEIEYVAPAPIPIVPTPVPKITQKTCTSNATLQNDNSCRCNDGYAVNENKSQCITMLKWCTNNYGLNIHPEGKQCICDTGYSYDASSKSCKTQLVPIDKNIPTPQTTFQNTQSSCEKNSTPNKDGGCTCNKGYGAVNGQCVTMVNYCISNYGKNIHPEGQICTCDTGYVFEKSNNGVADEINNRCILLSDWNKKNGISQPTSNTEITNTTTPVNPEPVKQIPWYQKIFNWFIGK